MTDLIIGFDRRIGSIDRIGRSDRRIRSTDQIDGKINGRDRRTVIAILIESSEVVIILCNAPISLLVHILPCFNIVDFFPTTLYAL